MSCLQKLRDRILHGDLLAADPDLFTTSIVRALGAPEIAPVARHALNGSYDAALSLWQEFGLALRQHDPAYLHSPRFLCAHLMGEVERRAGRDGW